MAGDDTEPSTTELSGRIDALDTKLDQIIDMFGKREQSAHSAAQEHAEQRLDRPSTIAEEIRAQLDAHRAAEAEAAEKRSGAERLAAVEERLSGMAEKTPESPPRRAEKFMGWR